MFLKDRKGQSALEYLMTYGWALIVIVVVIAALYFIIPKTQAQCSLTSGNLTLDSYTLSASNMNLSVVTGPGKLDSNINLLATVTTGTGAFATDTNTAGPVQPGTKFTKTLGTTTALSGNVSIDLTLTYYDGTFTQQAKGRCSGQF
ncbi:MAG: hypothetical protein HY544_00040 [Candidatus Diapherotrites archaeon]|uniref:Class III signal peptide-containing protein n=1 Tax=Candidatus Iainarchaeum sp. TaxID=3101447 RepID=A0A8T3YKP8_9ARCH|nr:hypothetical protein [Candidatus Diapherotrites archaeon]